MASAQSPSYFLSPMISPTGSTSPHSPTPLPVSSPELLSESEHPPPIHTSSGRSTPPTLFPASSETPLPSPTYSPARSTHLSIVDTRPDLASPSGSRSRSSSLRYAFPPPRTPPRTPLVEQANTSRTTTTPSAASPSTKRHNNGHVPGSLSRTRSPGSGPLANIRRNSQDRRVRSEGLAPRASPMARRKSASLVTGGYVTSESDSLSDKDDGGDASARPSSSHVTTSFFSSRPTQLVVQERRKRAQSLMSPIPVSDHSPSGDGSGSTRSFGSGRSDKRKPQDIAAVDYAHPDRERSQSVSNSRPPALPRSSLLRANGHSNPRSPLSSNPPSRLPSARVAPAEASSSRHPSYRSAKNGHERVSSSRSPPRNLEELPARSREVDRVRHEEGVSSSEGSRKGKERARDSSTKRNALAASLAHSSRSRDSAVLTDGGCIMVYHAMSRGLTSIQSRSRIFSAIQRLARSLD